jgi:hypothetical protein
MTNREEARASLDRMVEIADESGMYDLPPEPEPEPGRGRSGHSFDEALLAAQEAYCLASEAYTAARETYLAALDSARASARISVSRWEDIKRRARERGGAAEDVQPNFSAALKVDEKGEGSGSGS